jgi:hypothetical protein
MQRCLESVLSRAFKRNWICASALALCAGVLALAPTAGASVTLGQLAPETPSADCTTSGLDYLQPSVTGGNLYIARQAGRIVSWSTRSAAAGATYVFKIFRRTTDPDFFQVISHASPRILTSGVNTVPVSLHVESGDMIGFNESGPPNSCTFGQAGDNVLNHAGDLADGTPGLFTPRNDVRLNLTAVLVADNGFTIGPIAKDRKRGTATITVTTTNPGFVSIAGKGIKRRPSKTLAVAGPATFSIAAIGKTKRRLARKGRVPLAVQVTFSPNEGDSSTQTLDLNLRLRKPRAPMPKP